MNIELLEGDITTLAVEAVVNAANSRLQHGGGVAGAIVRKGGPLIQQESDRIGFVPVGGVAVTTAGNLPCGHVIHAVGPQMGEGDEDRKLRQATQSSLDMAEEMGLRSVAFPAISTGIFGFPLDRCAEIMLETTRQFASRARSVETVIFCLHGSEAYRTFRETLERMER